MKTKFEHNGFRAFSNRASTVRRSWIALSLVAFVSMQAAAQARWTNCDPVYRPSIFYPALSLTGDATVDGQAGVFFYLLDDRALVERIDGCFYEVDVPVLEIDFDDLDQVTLVLELPEYPAGAQVYVTDRGDLIEKVNLRGSSFTYVLTYGAELGFEIAMPGMPAPTVPVLVTKPTTDGPEPV
jgi:hypothetical protein